MDRDKSKWLRKETENNIDDICDTSIYNKLVYNSGVKIRKTFKYTTCKEFIM